MNNIVDMFFTFLDLICFRKVKIYEFTIKRDYPSNDYSIK